MLQGYKISLIPVLVRGVPSLHTCLDLVPELLAQPQLSQPRALDNDSLSDCDSTSTSNGIVLFESLSLFVCKNFVDFLEDRATLTLRETSRQVFAIHLAAHLANQYAVPHALGVARLCFDVITTFLSGGIYAVLFSMNSTCNTCISYLK